MQVSPICYFLYHLPPKHLYNFKHLSIMPEQLSLSLRAFPPVEKEKETLKYLISRINQQKGSFRNVTEQSLEEEIEAQDAGKPDEDEQDVIGTVEEVEDVKTKQEVVTKAREDVIKYIG